MTTIPLPAWMPPAGGGALVIPCGQDFDAVRVAGLTALQAAGRFPGGPPPLIEDQEQHVASWLLPPGAAATWLVPGTDALGAGANLAVPPATWCCGPWSGGPAVRWLVPPAGDCLTDPETLRLVLTSVLRGSVRHA
ncbi:hypothetical protein [Streptomyces hoynatensis]|uniref:Uncharacterized protein n=1 Tax=Streptomyces hoynatensis TaxID=1141874 RepID=A0A3A9ZED4_9ACTN|nr:hypothetical protein [Streptomyces hoynatensis]RKN46842.1 hypothetical protein D7294_01085 [Streptomyces hoynatensis]